MAIDAEIRSLIESAHDEAWEILVEYRDVLDELVLRLMDKETLDKNEVLEVFAPVVKRPTRGSYTGVGKRLPSDLPPVMTPNELARLGPEDVADLVRTTNGSGTNGSGTNGSGTNGSGTNGSGTNGSRANGSAANGSGAPRAAAPPRVPAGGPGRAPEPSTPGRGGRPDGEAQRRRAPAGPGSGVPAPGPRATTNRRVARAEGGRPAGPVRRPVRPRPAGEAGGPPVDGDQTP